MLTLKPQPDPELVDRMRSQNVFAIVGSGVSIAARAPSWSCLLEGMAAEAWETDPSSHRTIVEALRTLRADPLRAATLLDSILGVRTKRAVCRQITHKRSIRIPKWVHSTDGQPGTKAPFSALGQLQPRNLKPTRVHRLLAQLPFRAVMTTNYDMLLDDAVPHDRLARQGLSRSYPHLPQRIRDKEWFLWKAHGDIVTPEDIVFTKGDYDAVAAERRSRESLRGLFQTAVPLWVGYGHRDPDLDLLVDECSDLFDLSGGFSFGLAGDERLAARFQRAKIAPIWLPQYGDLELFLQQLAIALNTPLVMEFVTRRRWRPAVADKDGEDLAERLSGIEGRVHFWDARQGSTRLLLEGAAETVMALRDRARRGDERLVNVLREFEVVRLDDIQLQLPSPDMESDWDLELEAAAPASAPSEASARPRRHRVEFFADESVLGPGRRARTAAERESVLSRLFSVYPLGAIHQLRRVDRPGGTSGYEVQLEAD
jgi:hypothetical protein